MFSCTFPVFSPFAGWMPHRPRKLLFLAEKTTRCDSGQPRIQLPTLNSPRLETGPGRLSVCYNNPFFRAEIKEKLPYLNF